MTIDEFSRCIEDLEKYFNRRLTDDQRDVWFKKLENYFMYELAQAIDIITSHEKTFPTPAIVIEQIAVVRQKTPLSKSKIITPCSSCGGSGTISAQKTDNGVTYTYAFNCNKCLNSSAAYMTWGDLFEQQGFERIDDSKFDTLDYQQAKGLLILKNTAKEFYEKIIKKFPFMKQSVEALITRKE